MKANTLTSIAAKIIIFLLSFIAVIVIFSLFHIVDPVVGFILKNQDLTVFIGILILVILVYRFLKNKRIL